MALPKFENSVGASPYVWEEFPSLPSDRADLTTPTNFESYVIEHKRNGIIVNREIIRTRYIWELFFKNVTVTFIENLRTYAQLGTVRFYPDSAVAFYWDVYWISTFRAKLQRGGTYNLSVTLLQK